MDSICAGSMLAIMSVICLIIAGSCMMCCICAGSIPGGIPMGAAGMLGAVCLPPACCGAIVVAGISSTLSESASDTWPSSTVLLGPCWLLLLAVPLPLSDGRSVWELAGTAGVAAFWLGVCTEAGCFAAPSCASFSLAATTSLSFAGDISKALLRSSTASMYLQ